MNEVSVSRLREGSKKKLRRSDKLRLVDGGGGLRSGWPWRVPETQGSAGAVLCKPYLPEWD